MPDNLSVTAGYGTVIASQYKGGANHQRVIVHRQRAGVPFQPPALAKVYMVGQAIGGEMQLQNVFRLAGDTSEATGLVVALVSPSAAEFDLFLYPAPLATTPIDRGAVVMASAELASVLLVIPVRAGDYHPVGGGMVATVCPPVGVLQAGAGSTGLYAVVVAVGNVSLPSVDALSLVLHVNLD